jgi:hypothetical protein
VLLPADVWRSMLSRVPWPKWCTAEVEATRCFAHELLRFLWAKAW